MRSVAEILFRLRQEAANAFLFVVVPSAPLSAPRQLPHLPPPEDSVKALRGSEFAAAIEELAQRICDHRFPLLGYEVETGEEIRWRRDYVRQVESDLRFFRRVPYLNAEIAGDHKLIWELNRHQHLVTLAQAWLLTRNPKFVDEISSQLLSWWDQNPYLRGINWASALEVAYRAFSWIWIYHLAGSRLGESCTRRLLQELYRHGAYLEHNLSVYFSPNTHLLGEAVVLHALGVCFPDWPRAGIWRSLGRRIVAEEMKRQVRDDGSHFEQSTAYHIYATDLFLFHALLEPADDAYRNRLRRMADYLAALTSPDGTIPLMGDDDGGRLFHPCGDRRRFGNATLATCCVFFGGEFWPYRTGDLAEQAAWWCGDRAFAGRPGQPESPRARLFAGAGVAVLCAGPTYVVADTRGFGHANAGHSHAHALQLVCRHANSDILIDPGTYTYVAEPEWRSRFRGTAFHNTLEIDGRDQAEGAGPFRWKDQPVCEVLSWSSNDEWSFLDATCTYRGVRHRRLTLWVTDCETLAVVDRVESASEGEESGNRGVRQFWHCGQPVTVTSAGNYRIGGSALLAVPPESRAVVREGGEYGWQSEVPGHKVPRPVIVAEQTAGFPVTMGAMLFLSPQPDIVLRAIVTQNAVRLSGGDRIWLELPFSGDPVIRWSEECETADPE